MRAGELQRLTPLEVACSWLPGLGKAPARERSGRSPRAALEDLLLEHSVLGATVAFSGGRDSSAVLALAVDVARRHGLPDPVPITEVYEDDQASEETQWQELVVRHLRLDDWCRLRIAEDGDLLGPQAQESLLHHGLAWPPAAHVKSQLFAAAAGRVLLTGEGGDEVLSATRNGPVRELVREHRWAGRGHGTALIESIAPVAARRSMMLKRLGDLDHQPWLTTDAKRTHLGALASDLASEPFSRASAIGWLTARRVVRVSTRTRQSVAASHGAMLVDPLLNHDVVGALADLAGIWGWRGRTTALRSLVGDLLPEPVLSRQSKALFNTAYFGPHARSFARQWHGGGLDPGLVHGSALRSEWLSPVPSALSFLPLHAAWLASRPQDPRTSASA